MHTPMRTSAFLAPNFCRTDLFGCVTNNTSPYNRRAMDCRRSTLQFTIRAEQTPEKSPDGKKPAKKSKGKAVKPAPPQKRGLFGRLSNTFLRPIVTVPGGGKGGELYECVFCEGSGICDCDACRGSGKDAFGTCFMCDGKTSLTCTVCNGVGTVDRIRRGGTDDMNEYLTKKKR